LTGCLFCSEAKMLGPLKEQGVFITEDWCNYKIKPSESTNRETKLGSLRNKIKKHSESRAHELAARVVEQRNSESVVEQLFEKRAEIADKETESLFRTAYHIAKLNRPFSEHEKLVSLQTLNGINLGSTLHSRYSATEMICHIATEMRQKVVKHIVESSSKFSVLIDESTTLSKKATMAVYLRTSVGKEAPIFIFLDLVELDGQTSNDIVLALDDCFKSAGFSEEFLRTNFIAFISDGASVMLGKKTGVATQLKSKYPGIFTWHCLNHRLELAVHDAQRDIAAINHFRSFLDTVYSLFNQSSKNQRELKEASVELEAQILRIGRVLDVRWVASSFRTIKAVWVSFEALAKHFSIAAKDHSRDSRERAKYEGLLKRLSSHEFVLDLGLMYDVLSELASLSEDLQHRSKSLTRANMLIGRTIRVLTTFKGNLSHGAKYEEAEKAIKAKTPFHNVTLTSNAKLQKINKDQFLQSLVDNLTRRLCQEEDENSSEFLKDLDILDTSKWPEKPSIRHGEKQIERLCSRFRLNAESAIRGMRDFIDEPGHLPKDLKALSLCIETILVSSSEVEHGFSVMNLICTDLRTSLLVSNISNLMFININGPPIELFHCQSYVKTWKKHHSLATDPQPRRCKPPKFDDTKQTLWKVCNDK